MRGLRSPGPVPPERRLGSLVPAAHCQAPAAPAVSVRRTALLARFQSERRRPLVIVVAPAGYGKTTTAAQWAQASGQRIAWARITSDDDDPTHLVQHIAASLDRVAPLDPALISSLVAAAPDPCDVLSLLRRVWDSAPPHLLVLDDLHLLEPGAFEGIERAVDLAPEHVKIVLLARAEPGLRVARRRVQGEVLDITASDLGFDEAEAAQLFANHGLALDEQAVADLHAHAEGWPAGLHLLASAVERSPSRDHRRLLLEPDQRTVDFLAEELLGDLDADTVGFLQRSATLERMTTALLDRMLDRHDSHEQLTRIERMGSALLVPLDEEREWYRYNRLFGQVLRTRFRSQQPRESRWLHSSASRIAVTIGDIDGSIHHALQADEPDRASRLVYRRACPLALSGRADDLKRWLDGLGERRLDDDALACLAMAWYGVAVSDVGLVRRCAARAVALGWDGPLPDGSRSVDVPARILRATIADGGIRDAVRHAALARVGDRETNPWWATAAVIEALSLWEIGHRTRSREVLSDVLPTMADSPVFAAAGWAHLAWLSLDAGDLAEGRRCIETASTIAADHHLEGISLAVSVFAVAALFAALDGDRDAYACARDVAGAQLVRVGVDVPCRALFGHVVLGRAALAAEDLDRARAHAQLAARAQDLEPNAPGLDAALKVLQDGVSGRSAAQRNDVALTKSERRVLLLLPSHLSVQQIADQLHVSRNTAKTHQLAIYRKLDVSTRSEAVEAARVAGLIADS